MAQSILIEARPGTTSFKMPASFGAQNITVYDMVQARNLSIANVGGGYVNLSETPASGAPQGGGVWVRITDGSAFGVGVQTSNPHVRTEGTNPPATPDVPRGSTIPPVYVWGA